MSKVYVSHNTIVSSLGYDSPSVVQKIKDGRSGLQTISDIKLLDQPICASIVDTRKLPNIAKEPNLEEKYTRLEQMLLVSLGNVIQASQIELTDRVGLIISTTKGNIDVLDHDSPFPRERAYLAELGKVLKDFFGFKTSSIVLSNACVSGLLAIAAAKKLIAQDCFDHVFITGGDLVSKFTLSGFNAFQALSAEPCRPYDKNRSGINIGEVAASALITKDNTNLAEESVVILGDASCNDANHISGPSRTGEGLYRSVKLALKEAKSKPEGIDFISAHGTATLFNDEMEAIAFNRLNFQNTPLNSLKGFFGHTLGASGLLETIVGMHSLHQNTLFASQGFEEIGVSQPINVIKKTEPKPMDTFLKTSSGFGGSNTAIVFKKVSE
ncbi:beta-ketoacyl synthase N-terminal-like domain-containing protein [Ulvibacterium marinum]|uniref:beta-ketoacyl synthase N-terminal-like domain-containing protein n=1 Tax=Ulvibacterium marinum TaxID=2419782 RepID=UPI0024949C45|nr:beta-ketoacyl synthase N-terminal-like domain-containing protein [Ulvibacterium marinum]